MPIKGFKSGNPFPTKVKGVLDPYRVIINREQGDDIDVGMRVLVYGMSDETKRSTRTGRDLGPIEIVKGIGTVYELGDKTAFIRLERNDINRPFMKRLQAERPITGSRIRREPPKEMPFPQPTFPAPEVGDLVKPI